MRVEVFDHQHVQIMSGSFLGARCSDNFFGVLEVEMSVGWEFFLPPNRCFYVIGDPPGVHAIIKAAFTETFHRLPPWVPWNTSMDLSVWK